MRELDELLLRYLERDYPGAPDAEKRAFEALLDLPDPELSAYLLQSRTPETDDLAYIVRRLHGGTLS